MSTNNAFGIDNTLSNDSQLFTSPYLEWSADRSALRVHHLYVNPIPESAFQLTEMRNLTLHVGTGSISRCHSIVLNQLVNAVHLTSLHILLEDSPHLHLSSFDWPPSFRSLVDLDEFFVQLPWQRRENQIFNWPLLPLTLRNLRIEGTSLTRLPQHFAELTQLEEFDLTEISLRNCPVHL